MTKAGTTDPDAPAGNLIRYEPRGGTEPVAGFFYGAVMHNTIPAYAIAQALGIGDEDAEPILSNLSIRLSSLWRSVLLQEEQILVVSPEDLQKPSVKVRRPDKPILVYEKKGRKAHADSATMAADLHDQVEAAASTLSQKTCLYDNPGRLILCGDPAPILEPRAHGAFAFRVVIHYSVVDLTEVAS